MNGAFPQDLAARAALEAAQAAGIGIAIVEIVDGVPRFVFVSDTIARLVGRGIEAIKAEPPFDILVPSDRARLKAAFAARLRGESPSPRHECSLSAERGPAVPVEVGVHLFRADERQYEVLIVHDLRERRAAEARVAESERRFRELVEAAPDGVVISRSGIVVYVNRAGAKILGVSPQELVGQPLGAFLVPEDAVRMRERIMALTRGERLAPAEYRARRADGRLAVAEIASLPFDYEGAPAVLAFARDVTERAAMQAELAQSDRLAALGRVTAGMAHEINNPLGFATLSAESLDARLRELLPAGADRTEALELLENIRRGVARVAGIVRDLKAFSRDEGGTGKRAELDGVLDAAVRMVAHELAPRARLVRDVPPSLPAVIGDAARLEQVFVNLLVNAAQSLPEGGKGTVTLRGRASGDDVVVEVVDDGAGIAPDVLGRVFEPFFTTKPTGAGTGLGLSICHGIVRAFGGDVTVESTPGQGTTARVRLVRASTPPATVASTPEKKGVARARVLVVEDTPTFARMIDQILSRKHDVTVVGSVRDAVSAIEANGATFQVVLCDMTLGDGTGVDVYDLAAKRRPDLAKRFVLMTGGAFTPRVVEFLDKTTLPRLDKPFTIATLEAAIEAVVAPA